MRVTRAHKEVFEKVDETTPQEKEKQNGDRLFSILQKLDPKIHYIVWKLQEKKIDPVLVETFIRFVITVCEGERWGKVIAHIQEGKVVRMEGTQSKSFVVDENNIKVKS